MIPIDKKWMKNFKNILSSKGADLSSPIKREKVLTCVNRNIEVKIIFLYVI